VSALGLPTSATNEHDQPGIRMGRDQGQKIVAVAGAEKLTVVSGIP
jgi:hypothetical protein